MLLYILYSLSLFLTIETIYTINKGISNDSLCTLKCNEEEKYTELIFIFGLLFI